MTPAVVDAGPLLAAIDAADIDHVRCREAVSRPDLRLCIPALVVTEVCRILASRRGASVEAAFLATLADYDVLAPLSEDWPRIASLVREYADFPLGAADASVLALAERLDTDLVLTLDRRHFSAVRPRHCNHLQLLPE